jgi:HPr kinase/phosphorylase
LPTYRFTDIVERLAARATVEVLVQGDAGGARIAGGDVHRPGMALMGYTDGFPAERVQVFGETELGYLASISPAQQRTALGRLFDLQIPGAFVARGMTIPAVLLDEATLRGVPLARADLATPELAARVGDILDDLFSPRTTLHGTLVDVYGVGLLITGKSGIGKSETALDLVERGHRLVADDLVEVTQRAGRVLLGRGRQVLQHNMEIRGVGVVDVFPIFGVRAIRMQKRIEVEVRLEEWVEGRDYDRMGLSRDITEILGVRIPRVEVPIFPGKNITVIAEVIALDFMLKLYGIDSARELSRKLLETMAETGDTARYLEHDIE